MNVRNDIDFRRMVCDGAVDLRKAETTTSWQYDDPDIVVSWREDDENGKTSRMSVAIAHACFYGAQVHRWVAYQTEPDHHERVLSAGDVVLDEEMARLGAIAYRDDSLGYDDLTPGRLLGCLLFGPLGLVEDAYPRDSDTLDRQWFLHSEVCAELRNLIAILERGATRGNP